MSAHDAIPHLLNARQVAERLNVSHSTLMRWTHAGTIPVIRLPTGTLRYRADEIDRWLEEQAA